MQLLNNWSVKRYQVLCYLLHLILTYIDLNFVICYKQCYLYYQCNTLFLQK